MATKYTVEEYTFQLPGGTTFSSRLESNNSTTLVLEFPNGIQETFNSGTFLTCTLVSAAAYLKVNFVMKGKFPDAIKFDIAKWVSGVVASGCTFAVNTYETYQNEDTGGGGGGDDSGGGRSPNDTGGSNPMAPGYGENPKKGYLEIKPASMDPGMGMLSPQYVVEETKSAPTVNTQESAGDAEFISMMMAAHNAAGTDSAEIPGREVLQVLESILALPETLEIIGTPAPVF